MDKRIIAVGGGKGGVGKSLVATNLAVCLSKKGKKVILVDADLGAANLHTLLGIDRKGHSLYSYASGRIDKLQAATLPTGIVNLDLIAGTGAIPGSADLSGAQKERLLAGVRALEADVVLIDVGAGISYDVLDLYLLADQRLAVVLPQLTSFQNAYSFLKGAVYRVIESCADSEAQYRLLADNPSASETDRVSSLLTRVEAEDPPLGGRIRAQLKHFGVKILGNQVIGSKDRSTMAAVARMFKDFLGLDAPVLGSLRFNRKLADSINMRRPLALIEPKDDCMVVLDRVAHELLNEDLGALRAARAAPEPDALVSEIQALLY